MKHRGSRDLPVAMPRRRPSLSNFPTSFSNRLLLPRSTSSATSLSQCSPKSSMQVLDSYTEDVPQRNNDFHAIGNEPRSSDSSAAKKVRFAPLQVHSTITVMGLGDYTVQELGACWYSRNDSMQGRRNRKKPLDTRWSV